MNIHLKKRELAVLLVLILGLSIWAFLPRSGGKAVTVTVEGEEIGTWSLAEDCREDFTGYNGYSLVMVISDGNVHVEDAACPDLICQSHSPTDRDGDQIICLPARIVITVTGVTDGEEVIDAVAG